MPVSASRNAGRKPSPRFSSLAPPVPRKRAESRCNAVAFHDGGGGIGASAGVVEGLARVVFDPAAEVLHAGEILIAPFTDPGWTPLFTHAAGLATEVGGLMTHGSVIARELGIPAVVGAAGVTKRVKTGDRVRVDGNRGYVEVIVDRARIADEAGSQP